MEGPHGSGGSEPPETIAFLKGLAWGFGLAIVGWAVIWLVTS
jgi:hypothetical protein